jgi:lyso-ornithine lipid O-acyltransferase
MSSASAVGQWMAEADRKMRSARNLAWISIASAVGLPPCIVAARVAPNAPPKLPRFYHGLVCKAIGFHVHEVGQQARDKSVLYVINHISWVDIPVIGSRILAHFVAKSEIEGWGIFGRMADLQQTIYVNREQRHRAGEQRSQIAQRLADGHNVILFPEGTSGLGSNVLPFKTSLFGVTEGMDDLDVLIQPVTIAYTHMNGLPMIRANRFKIAWIGDMELLSHAWDLIGIGRVDAKLIYHDPVRRQDFKNRKELARHCEAVVGRGLRLANAGRL